MSSAPVLTIWRRQYLILNFKDWIILTAQKFSTYYMLLMNSAILAEPPFWTSTFYRKRNFSAPYNTRCINSNQPMPTKCVEVWNWPHSEMHRKVLEFPTFDGDSIHNLIRTGDMKFVHWCSNMIRIHSRTMYWLNFRMDCCTTMNHFTALHLLSI